MMRLTQDKRKEWAETHSCQASVIKLFLSISYRLQKSNSERRAKPRVSLGVMWVSRARFGETCTVY